jgi:hypothetical protein
LLLDGRFHRLEELREKTGLGEEQIIEIVGFLTKYGFTDIDSGNRKVRISRAARKYLYEQRPNLPSEKTA